MNTLEQVDTTTITSADLARAADVSEQQIGRWVRTGRLHPLPSPRRTRAYRFARQALELAKELGRAWHLLRGRR